MLVFANQNKQTYIHKKSSGLIEEQALLSLKVQKFHIVWLLKQEKKHDAKIKANNISKFELSVFIKKSLYRPE